MRIPLLLIFFFLAGWCRAQDHGYKFGSVSLPELQLTRYAPDTAAHAVMLNEFGDSWIRDADQIVLVHDYQARIKILDSKGLDQATIIIPIRKSTSSSNSERVVKVVASTFNLENDKITETSFDGKTFLETKSKFHDLVKFTLPNVKVGSVLEIKYQLESPYLYNFRRWEFQGEIPKVQTEYWAKIPGNYVYNMTLIGGRKLDKNESELIKDCFSIGAGKADCARYKYVMKNVPAFTEEEYMTARSNYLAALNFELSEIKYFDGRVKRLTKNWKDADQEMYSDPKFGLQLKRGKEVFKARLDPLLQPVTDSLQRAQLVYDFVKNWFKWNDYYGCFSDIGIKKAYDAKSGNVADINLALVAALQYAGFNAIPVILSTRANGLPIELHPVISDFDYVIGQVAIQGKTYQLDATDPYLPFGLLPMHCLNGKGRALPKKGDSYWTELKPTDKQREVTLLALQLQPDGTFKGSLTSSLFGYDALRERKRIASYNNQEEYIEAVDDKLAKLKIIKYEIGNLAELSQTLTRKYEVEIQGFDSMNKSKYLLEPFMGNNWQKNPFVSLERSYPVDLGAPMEEQLTISLEYPADLIVTALPEPVALALPNGGGKYLFHVQNNGNRLSINSLLLLNRSLYSPEEYHHLKELFNRIVQTYKSTIILTKRT